MGLFGQVAVRDDCCCGNGCCYPRCAPLEIISIGNEVVEVEGRCSNPLPLTLTVEITATSTWGDFPCFNGSGVITYRTPLSDPPGLNCWEGTISGSCLDCNNNVFNWSFDIVICCNEASGNHTIGLRPSPGQICPATTITASEVTVYACNPFYVSGCFPEFGGCWVACLDDIFMPTEPPSFNVCFVVYEEP